MILILLKFIHVIVCLFLIGVVLLQSGKAADLAGAFGGMGSQTAFGPRGAATVLSKATTIAAALFMVTSLSLSIFATRETGGASPVLETSSPAAPKQDPKATPPPDPNKMPAGSVTLTPEGGDPSKSKTVQLPTVEEIKKATDPTKLPGAAPVQKDAPKGDAGKGSETPDPKKK